MRGISVYNLFNIDVDSVQRFVVKSQNLLIKASSTHTAVGAAHGTGRGPVQLPVYFLDVVPQASLRLPITVQKHMPGTTCPSLPSARNLMNLSLQGRGTSGPSGGL